MRIEPTEHDEQAAVVAWCALMATKTPEYGLIYANLNGGYRLKKTAGRLKAEGSKAGIPDLFLPHAAQGFHGLYIEMKTAKGRLSLPQINWISTLRRQGYRVEVCYGQDQAKRVLQNYLEEINE